MTLIVHDVYAVIGEREFDFEDAVRDEYRSAIADDDTRLLWYLYSSHGAGNAYVVVMLTAVRDGAALERLSDRLRYGDLADWSMRVSALRYSAVSSLLVPAEWSPIAELDLASIPVGDVEHPVAVFREDTLEGRGVHEMVATSASRASSNHPGDILTCEAGFRSALDPDRMVRILYRVAEQDRWTPTFGADSGWDDWPGSLTPRVPDGIQGSGRYLRTTSWSPMA
jgi:hypothetical protein